MTDTDTTLLPISVVAQKRRRSRSQLYVDVRKELMTPPLPPRPGRKGSAIPAYEVDAINRAEIAGATDEQIRALVRRLIEQRTEARQPAAA